MQPFAQPWTLDRIFNTLDLHDHSEGNGLPVMRIGLGADGVHWLLVTVLNPDGTTTTTQQLAVSLADEQGRPLALVDEEMRGQQRVLSDRWDLITRLLLEGGLQLPIGFQDRSGAIHVRTGNEGVVPLQHIHAPAANTQATITRSSAGAGLRIVCTALTVVLAATATAPAAVNLGVNLIDGVTAGTTYLWRSTISLPATAGAMNGINKDHCWFMGSPGNSMTLEFSATGGANTIESVAMSTVTVPE